MKKCPECGCEADKVIYMGFPMKLCPNERCNTLWGFWSWIPCIWFNGWFMKYKGCYFDALIAWLAEDYDI